MNFLISRTDNIGDVILTLPIAAILKEKYPDAKILFLARDYVKAVVDDCPYVDTFISWDELNTLPVQQAAQMLSSKNIDTILHVFPRKKIAFLAKKAKIPVRIGTQRRWYHYLTCNKRINFSRAKSNQHEAQLNLQLLHAFNIYKNYSLDELNQFALLESKKNYSNAVLVSQKFNLIIHPLSNGNSREWPIEYFCKLIHSLPLEKFNIIITGSQSEKTKLQPLFEQCPMVTDLSGRLNLTELIELIHHADGLIANSTGPLHIAAASGIKTLGLFPPAQTMCPKRWQPIGKQAQFVVVNQACDAQHCNNQCCACMRAISVDQVRNILLQWT